MGAVSLTDYPRQSRAVGWRCSVAFRDVGCASARGVVVRCDDESPSRTVVRLDDGRHVVDGEFSSLLFDEVPVPSPSPPVERDRLRAKYDRLVARFAAHLQRWRLLQKEKSFLCRLLRDYHLDSACGHCGGPLDVDRDVICRKCVMADELEAFRKGT